ncbi:Glucose-repressible alcohol dehydrogenase transcriptional effector [Hondaea fermentalgiana]|uniref:Glucose-repressible alcohol dehydrogenase transcriptional effector n=1 Tax=Hondaea fermentalgiana TaxID=2315210 RepID=A0A2R5GQN4_9STRA|nr:Glucose-repressible alcohol dehydrogenase transcriptional effector [Hondaea fermentalgiana]|eukprot:GBG33160.1 Glucose-repressible alcohol dehydrogenase transcriptional effector [Hondaea fermentalgiana]
MASTEASSPKAAEQPVAGAPASDAPARTNSQATAATPAAKAGVAGSPRWRVATYNLLSPNLCSPGYFINCKAEDCEPSKRYERAEAKLKDEIEQQGIVCLQEVAHAWLGNIHKLCAENNYTYVHDSYGYYFNGYMGVGIAFSNEKYALEDCKVSRISETKKGGYRPDGDNRRRNDSLWSRAYKIVAKTVRSLLELIWPPEKNLWFEVERRSNTAVFVRLRDRATNQKLCVATYHMPCAFRTPPVISAHCSLLAKRINKLAQTDPFVIAGDFNLKPDSPMYELLTQGKFMSDASRAEGDMPAPAYPGDAWTMDSGMPKLKSAYADVQGKEPEFTNLACTRSQPESSFVETLDYLFYSGTGLRAESVDPLPSRSDVADIISFPTANEPSDHIKIAAEFTTGNKRTEEEKQRRRELYLARKAQSEAEDQAKAA